MKKLQKSSLPYQINPGWEFYTNYYYWNLYMYYLKLYIHTLNYTSTCTHLKQKKNHCQNLHKDRNYEISNCSARIRLDDTVLVLSMLHSISTFHASFSIRTSIWYLYNNMYRFLILFMTFYCQKYRLGQEWLCSNCW